MIQQLLALIIFMHNPTGWKDALYDYKYSQSIKKVQNIQIQVEAYKSDTRAVSGCASGIYRFCKER